MIMNSKKHKKLSKINALHYFKLGYRSLLFIIATIAYIVCFEDVRHAKVLSESSGTTHWILIAIWIVYAIEMLLRFFPSSFESMGCQKQFARNYRPTGRPVSDAEILPNIRTLVVLIDDLLSYLMILYLF